jgi:hypothetical protein
MKITIQAQKRREEALSLLDFPRKQEGLRRCREEERAERGWEREVQRGTGRC